MSQVSTFGTTIATLLFFCYVLPLLTYCVIALVAALHSDARRREGAKSLLPELRSGIRAGGAILRRGGTRR
ncbi:hypothetical protein [Nocardia caishijiensis]|uniref:Uncharacterized protein n=1 Tax=Nocardia caishijiensis TaxID=184756 RepID=A0ABQ6YKZ1_9NOCA|nr:hypothetical protein [Nocardia caishijiensis]KAF0846176.1 hypothetical protein FNL39_10587 [Nocardia caishijiensis]